MKTFTDTEKARLRAAFDTLVGTVGPAADLNELSDRPHRAHPVPQRRGYGLAAVAAIAALLLGIGLTALVMSSDTSPVASGATGSGDVIVFLPSNTPLDRLIAESDRVAAWDGVALASPWTSEDALREFMGVFADQPDLIAVVKQDPSVLPASVRIWVEPGIDPALIAQRATDEFPDALEISYVGEEQPDASNMPDTTLPDLSVLLTQVEPIHGYGDYSDYAYSAVPWAEVTAAEIACMQGQGWPVVAFSDTDTGIDFGSVPVEDTNAAQIDFARCVKGLNLPEYDGPNG